MSAEPERTFTFPTVTFGDVSYDSLVLREPTVSEMLKVSQVRGMNAIIDLVAMVSGVPKGAILLLPISVLRKCNAYLEQFTEEPPAGGNAEA